MADFSRSPVKSPAPVTLLGNGAFMAIFSTYLRETVMVPSMSAGGGLSAFGQGAVCWVVPWKWSAHLCCCSFLVVRSSHIATDLSVCLPKLSGERQQPTEKKTATHRGYEAANQVKKLKKKKKTAARDRPKYRAWLKKHKMQVEKQLQETLPKTVVYVVTGIIGWTCEVIYETTAGALSTALSFTRDIHFYNYE